MSTCARCQCTFYVVGNRHRDNCPTCHKAILDKRKYRARQLREYEKRRVAVEAGVPVTNPGHKPSDDHPWKRTPWMKGKA